MSNYRPISLTCVACKIMEPVITMVLLSYVRLEKIIDRRQHRFFAGCCTTTNLLESLNDWTFAIRDKKSVLVAYKDVAKALDTVCHRKLFSKLTAYGIAGNLLRCIQNFFKDRTQQTRIGSALAHSIDLYSGVVQGNVIGQLLILLYINDIIATLTAQKLCLSFYMQINLNFTLC
jgi:hypothetical protein